MRDLKPTKNRRKTAAITPSLITKKGEAAPAVTAPASSPADPDLSSKEKDKAAGEADNRIALTLKVDSKMYGLLKKLELDQKISRRKPRTTQGIVIHILEAFFYNTPLTIVRPNG